MPFYSYASASVNQGFNLTAAVRDASGAVGSNTCPTIIHLDSWLQVVASHTRLLQGLAVGLRLSLDAPHPETGTGTAVVLDGQVHLNVAVQYARPQSLLAGRSIAARRDSR